jgi:hypothetical protein
MYTHCRYAACGNKLQPNSNGKWTGCKFNGEYYCSEKCLRLQIDEKGIIYDENDEEDEDGSISQEPSIVNSQVSQSIVEEVEPPKKKRLFQRLSSVFKGESQ